MRYSLEPHDKSTRIVCPTNLCKESLITTTSMCIFAYSLASCLIRKLGYKENIEDNTSVNCALSLREEFAYVLA